MHTACNIIAMIEMFKMIKILTLYAKKILYILF